MRTFVAVRCPPGACRRMRRETDRLASVDGAFRALRTDDFHVTIQFLGNTDEGDLAAIGRGLAEAAARVAPFDADYRGLGAFPTADRARVVWVASREVDRPRAFADLAATVGDVLAPLGHQPERRAFHAHVTLGRVRRRPSAALVEAIGAGGAVDLGGGRVSELKLILSDPGKRGYSYIDLTTAPLTGTTPSGE